MRELLWSDLNWELKSLTVRSPKREAHANAVRSALISPQLQPILLEFFGAAEPGDPRLLPIASKSHGSIYQPVLRIREGLGLPEWPRLLQNMRAACETDWVATYPTHEVARWIGHSVAVAAKHYLHPRDTHFKAAVGAEPWAGAPTREVAKSVALTVQNR